MAGVVSLGSVNVDRIMAVDEEVLADIEAAHDWLPAPGETRAVPELPDAMVTATDETVLGGKGANQAVAAARAGASTSLLGAVGTDHADLTILPSLRAAGVCVDDVAVRERSTGTALIVVDPTAENRIAILPGANATLTPSFVHDRRETLHEADVILLQNEIPVEASIAALDVAEEAVDPPTVVVDPAPAAGADVLVEHGSADVVTPNAEEANRLRDHLRTFDGTVVYTRGPDPIRVAGPKPFTVAPPAVDPVDTTAAGDVFNGYLAAGMAEGGDRRTVLTRATAAASLSTESVGAQPSIPDRTAVREFLANRGAPSVEHT